MRAVFTHNDGFLPREINFSEYADMIPVEVYLKGLLENMKDNRIDIEDGNILVTTVNGHEVKITSVKLECGGIEFSDGNRKMHWYSFTSQRSFNDTMREFLYLYNAAVKTMLPKYEKDTAITTTEWCHECEEEVEIKANFRSIQFCPNCGKPIKPCSMCFMDCDSCKYCPFDNILNKQGCVAK